MLQKKYESRLKWLYILPFLFAGALIPRLWYLQVVRHERYTQRAGVQHNKTITIPPSRGRILDTNGHELAGSTLLDSVYVAPSSDLSPEVASEVSHELAKLLNLEFDYIHKRLRGTSNRPIARKIQPEVSAKVRDLIDRLSKKFKKRLPPGTVYFVQEGKRFYPRDGLASHVIGYTELDNTGDNLGRAGLERVYDKLLRGQARTVKARQNAKQYTLEPVERDVLASTYGHTLVLTIDEAIQHATENALNRRVAEVYAEGGVAVVYAVKTGEILAMANCPSYNLNDLANAKDFQRRNRAITDAIEPGSVMKIFSFASLFEDAQISVNDSVDCMGGTWNLGQRVLKDSHRMGVATAADVFKFSSNIGTVRLAMARLTPLKFHRRLTSGFGFGEKTGLDLPGEDPGVLRPVKQWSGLSMSSLPMGYELQVTAIQVAAAAGAIVNKGHYMQPHVVKEIRDWRGETVKKIEPTELRRVCSEDTSQRLLDLMELVVTGGTGKPAKLEHYRVGGKTGTTKKATGGNYQMRGYYSSFCGVAPIDNPEVLVYVYIDNPQGSEYYGGTVSAPVFKEIAETALKTLKVPVSDQIGPPSSMDVSLDTIRNELGEVVPIAFLDGATDQQDRVSSGTMPNLQGLSMREAKERLDKLGVDYDFRGSGLAFEQKPKPYESLDSEERVTVTFLDEQAWIEKMAVVARQALVGDSGAGAPDYSIEPASLRLEGRAGSAMLELSTQGLPKPPAARKALPTPEPTPTPLPDVDEFAKRTPPKNAGRDIWKKWETESKAEKVPETDNRTSAQKPTTSADPEAPQSSSRTDASRPKVSTPVPKVSSLYDIQGSAGEHAR